MEIISLIACIGILIVLCVMNAEYRDLIRDNAYLEDQIISKMKEIQRLQEQTIKDLEECCNILDRIK